VQDHSSSHFEQHSSERVEGIRQDDTSFVSLLGRGAYPRAPWLSHAVDQRPLQVWLEQSARWESLPRTFTILGGNHFTTLDIVSLDLGNRSAKLCAQNTAHQLVNHGDSHYLAACSHQSPCECKHKHRLVSPGQTLTDSRRSIEPSVIRVAEAENCNNQ
jgi:hypothetical protein